MDFSHSMREVLKGWPEPWGLGTDYDKFRNLIASEIGIREFDRLTASESCQGERADATSTHGVEKSATERRRGERHRAINRAPALVQQLYAARRLGPRAAGHMGRSG